MVGGNVYQSGVPGVGIQVLNQFRSITPVTDSVAQHTNYAFTAPALIYQLVVTGDVGVGRVSGLALPSVRYQFDNNLVIFDAKAGGQAIILASSCATPNVNISLGKHSLGDFQGINRPMKPAAVGFNVVLNSCPAGLTGIQYRIDPTTSILNVGSGVVALDGSSSASGVGIQLRSGDSGSALQFSTLYPLSGYNPAVGGSYTIRLLATYYQTNATIRPGTANTSLTFTMSYQ
jgi:major type 1 subunit fimbrin (pilin)